jgi:hypothetical protein
MDRTRQIPAIVIVSEASPPVVAELGEIACRAVVTNTVQVLTDTNYHSAVAAHDAAALARYLWTGV